MGLNTGQNDMNYEERERWEFLQDKDRAWQAETGARRKTALARYDIQPLMDKMEMQAEIESLYDNSRHGMSSDEWSDYQRLQGMRIRGKRTINMSILMCGDK